MGENLIDIRVLAKDMASGVLKNIRQNAGNFAKDFGKKIGQGAQQLTTFTAAVTAAGVAAMTAFGKSSVSAAADFEKAMTTLNVVAPRFGQNAEDLKKAAVDLGKQLRIGPIAAAESLQNLLKSGLNLDDAKDLLKRFTNEAITGKSSSIDLATAVQNLSFAYATNNSALGNLSGVSENFSDITEKGAKIMGKATKDMTDAELEMAKYKGMIELTNLTLGSAEEFTGTYIDKQAELANKINDVKIALGQFLMPILAKATDLVIRFIDSIDLESAIGQLYNLKGVVQGIVSILTGAGSKKETFLITVFGKGSAEKITKALVSLKEVIHSVINTLFPNKETFNEFAKIFGLITASVVALTAAIAILTSPLTIIIGIIALVSLAIVHFRDDIARLVNALKERLEPVINDARAAFEQIKPILELVASIVIDNLKVAWDNLVITFNEIKPLLQELFVELKPILEIILVIAGAIVVSLIVGLSLLIRIITEIAKIVIPLIIKAIIGWIKIFKGIISVVGDVVSWIRNAVNDIIGFFDNLINKAKQVVDTIKSFFTNLGNLGGSITAAIKDFINSNLIDRFNSIEIEVLGKVIGLPDIPRLAKGGDFVTRGPQLIMVGDNPGGQERVQVTPLSSPNINGSKSEGVNITNNFYNTNVDARAVTDKIAFQLQF